MDDKTLPLAVGAGTAALLVLAAVSSLSGTPQSPDGAQDAARTTVAEAAETAVAEAGETVTEAVAATEDTAEAVGEAVAGATDEAVTEAEDALAEAAAATEDTAETVATATDEAVAAADGAVEDTADATDAAPDRAAAGLDFAMMDEAQQKAFGEQVRQYLLTNPQVIMEAVAVLEEREAEQQAEQDAALVRANTEALMNDGYSWVGGNPDGDVTVVEFLDYRCGYCRRAHPEVEELIRSDGNIRFIVKEFPILGEASMISSRFAIATQIVAGDEAYKAMHDALITLEGEPTEAVLTRLGRTFGLDTDAILVEMQSDEVTRRISETRALARQLNISGTPSFVFDDQMLRGYAPLATMQDIIAEERSDG